jgi:cohesin domain-containing protein
MRKPPRIAVFLVILAAVGAWVILDEGPANRAPGAARESSAGADAREAPSAGGTADIRAELPARAPLQRASRNPFSSQNWTPAPAPRVAPAPAPAAAPVAPPLPYRYVGELVLPTGTQVFLARGDDTFRVSEGETLDGEYRVESLKAGELVFVHLASGQHQTLRLNVPGEDEVAAARGMLRAAASPAAAPTTTNTAATNAPAAAAPRPGAVAQAEPAKGAAAQPARMRWEGPASAKAGSSFNVALHMTSGEHIRSAPMEVRFDPKLLEPVSVRPGRYFGGNGAANFGYRINADGSIYIGVSNQASAPATDAELLVLTFKPIKAGTSAELSVAALNLQGPAGRPIAYAALTAFRTTITP